MNALEGIQNFLQFIVTNWTTIVVVIGLGIIVFNKIKGYLALTQQQKIDLAMKNVADVILSLVTSSQATWGINTGKIKKSEVLSEIYAKFPILNQAIDKDKLDAELNEMIDNAIKEMIEILKKKSEDNTDVTKVEGIEVATKELTNIDISK